MGSCARCHNQQSRFVYNWLDYKTAYADRWEIKRRIWDSWKGTYYKEPMPVANSPESLALTESNGRPIKNGLTTERHWGAPPAAARKAFAVSKDERIARGRQLFTACAACHQPTGRACPMYFLPWPVGFFKCGQGRAIKIVILAGKGKSWSTG